MFEYKISIDKRVIAILGPHLYGDTASIIGELVSNCYDADANNCWVTIKTGAEPEIVIEDDGIGMTPEEVNEYFLDIGYDRREERAVTVKGRRVFGRKGIGKLAAFSLARRIELYSQKGGTKAGCILDYEKITRENKNPEAIPDEAILFEPTRLSQGGTGTRLVLKDIQKNINTTYYYLVNRLIRNFNLDFDSFRIYIGKNDELARKVNYADLDFFDKMDTIVTIGEEYREKGDEVKGNAIPTRYKAVHCYEDDLKNDKKEAERLCKIPKRIKVRTKSGEQKEIEFTFEGWMGTIVNKGELKGLVIKEGANEEEQNSISINDNRITIFSRKRIGEYDVLPKVQTDTIYDAYVIGEIQVEIFEDDQLVDMAISNRRGYEETDERYRALIDALKSLIRFIVQKKAAVQKLRGEDVENEEAVKIKEQFASKSRTMDILNERLEDGERRIVEEENFQFVRATKLAQSTRRILISHDSENKEYGFFVMKIFELLGLDVDSIFIFTSHPPTGVPHGVNIYDYLKDCFREDIYVIFLFSRHFYDSNVCIAETGAAWATNRNHSNIIIDIDYRDVDKPIDSAKCSLAIDDLDSLSKDEAAKFVKAVYAHIDFGVPSDKDIIQAIEKAIQEFRGRLGTDSFYPRRKYQGHPVCSDPKCGNTMDLKKDGTDLSYRCRTPNCGKKTSAKIY
jgi:hypothetical protein